MGKGIINTYILGWSIEKEREINMLKMGITLFCSCKVNSDLLHKCLDGAPLHLNSLIHL